MFKRSIYASLAVLALVIAGCGAQKGNTKVTYTVGQEPILQKAPADGQYALYTATDLTPKTTKVLKKGDSLGFQRNAEGDIEAVAGDSHIELPGLTTEAYWKRLNINNKGD